MKCEDDIPMHRYSVINGPQVCKVSSKCKFITVLGVLFYQCSILLGKCV